MPLTAKVLGGKAFMSKAKRLTWGTYKGTDIGFFKSARYPDGTFVAAAAAWNEFGTRRAPERPFFRSAVRTMRKPIRQALRILLRGKGGKVDRKAADQIGLLGKSEIQVSIRRGGWVPNAPRTVRRKKSSRPLIDTGLMRRAVTWKTRLR